MSHRPGLLNSLGGEMNFVMQRVDYDPHRGGAYGSSESDAIATTIFSYRTRDKLRKKQVHAARSIQRDDDIFVGRFKRKFRLVFILAPLLFSGC